MRRSSSACRETYRPQHRNANYILIRVAVHLCRSLWGIQHVGCGGSVCWVSSAILSLEQERRVVPSVVSSWQQAMSEGCLGTYLFLAQLV